MAWRHRAGMGAPGATSIKREHSSSPPNSKFDDAMPFFPSGIAPVKLGDGLGYIDIQGKYIWNPSR